MKRSVQILLAALIVVSASCSQPPRPMRFNNMIVFANQRLAEEAKKFYKAMEPLGEGKNADVNAVRNSYKEIQTALKELQKQFERQKAPINSRPGEDLLDKYRSFLLVLQDIFDECFTPMLNAVEDNTNYPSPADKWARIQPLVVKASDKEKPSRDALLKLQDEYAKRHNLEPKY